MKLLVEVDQNQSVFAPGDRISGKVTWDLEKEAKQVTISLLWYTTGKGTRDTETIAETKVSRAGMYGDRHFEFELPMGPLSFSGTLITLSWAIEAVAYPDEHMDQYHFVLSHTGEEISLDADEAE